MTELFERAFRLNLLPPQYVNVPLKVAYNTYPEFNVEKLDYIDENLIPEFAYLIFEDIYISPAEKHNFARNFLVNYIKKENKGKYIVFIKNIYQGTNTLENIQKIGTKNGFPKIFKITQATKYLVC